MKGRLDVTIDNFTLVEGIMKFETSDDYYLVELIRRKKDFPDAEAEKIPGREVLYYWLVTSIEMLERLKPSLKLLCKELGARAYINLDRKSKKKTAMILMKELLSMVENDDYSALPGKTMSAAGQCKGVKDGKMFLVDIDERSRELVTKVLELIEAAGPDSLHYVLPTVNGYHILATPFNVQKFNDLGGKELKNVDIKHNSPTLLFYEKGE